MRYSIKTTALSLTAMLAAAGLLSWLLWWSSLASSDPASAQEQVERACQQLTAIRSYDMNGTVKVYHNGVLDTSMTMRGRVQGDDYHVRYRASDGRTQDFRRVNGVSYTRDSTSANQWSIMRSFELRDPGEGMVGLGDNPICPQTSNLRNIGSKNWDNQMVRRYSTEPGIHVDPFPNVPNTFRGEDRAISYEFYLNQRGQLQRYGQRTDTLKQSTASDRSVWSWRSNINFTGLGQRNTINVPTVVP